MYEATVKQLSASVEMVFSTPRSTFSLGTAIKDWCDRYAEKFKAPIGDPRAIRFLSPEQPFGYQLVAPLFAQPEAIRMDAFGLTISLANARTERDLLAVLSAVAMLLEMAAAPPGSTCTLRANVHAQFVEASAGKSFFEGEMSGVPMRDMGVTGVMNVASWKYPIRVSREPSLGAPNSVFVAFETQLEEGKTLHDTREAFAEAAKVLNLELVMEGPDR